MKRMERNSKLAAVAAALMIALARAHAQENPGTASPRIVVSIPDRKLALLDAAGEVRKVYSVAVGKPSTPSPTGTFTVINRLTNPTWYSPGNVVGPSPSNPLGTRWLGLDRPGYGIHGTNAPKSIGRAASHGCIRMAKADLEELFRQVRVGDVVEIHAERDETVARVFAAPAETLVARAAASPAVD